MKFNFRTSTAAAFICLAASLAIGLTAAPVVAQQDAGRGGRGGFGGLTQSNDPRVENRTYHFEDTDEDLPYCLFVSSKVSDDTENPLIVSLHGLGIGPGFMCRGSALDLAEEGGYILVAPMGYNPGGWYGSPVLSFGGRGGGGRGGDANPENLAELSEKDVTNVLRMIRDEFNVDENRTYLMGHSMGGAGTLFLGSKHADQWAALAPIAPAAFMMNDDRDTILARIKDGGVPLLVVQGDADPLVPVENTRMWVDTMEELSMDYEYNEIQGGDHGSVIEQGMAGIFEFFSEHTRE